MILYGLLFLPFVMWTTESNSRTVQGQYQETEYDQVDVTYIGPDSRIKKSLELPHEMHFQLKSAKTNIKIRLKRAVNSINIPTYITSNGRIKQVYIADYQGSGIYRDQNTGFAVMVSSRSGHYDLNGRVNINDNHVNVYPLNSGKHRLTSAMLIDYGPDEIQPSQKGHVSLYTMRSVMNNMRRMRYKRASKSYTVELLAVTDYTIKQRFLSRNGGNEDLANSEIKTYYAFLTMGMSERYSTISNYYPEVTMSVTGAGIVIANSADDAIYHKNSNKNGILEYITALSEFTDWVYSNTKSGDLPQHDHATWFTDDVLAIGKSTEVIGVAWVGTMCTKNSTSIVEEYFTGRTEQIAAHELGHSLNAVHDGDVRGCSNSDSYVMAASSYFPEDNKRTHPWIFSECSALYISYYAPEFKCLSSQDSASSLSTTALAGQYLNADEQCKIFYGTPNSYFCRNEQAQGFGFDLMCQRMYCYDPSSASCQTVIAKEFTSCGSGMWCYQGACTASSSAPITLENCPQGDNNAMGCYAASCSLYDNRKLMECCQTCIGYVPVIQANNNKNNDNKRNKGGGISAAVESNLENGDVFCQTWDCKYCKSDERRMKSRQCSKYR